jgi:hypothetical protein
MLLSCSEYFVFVPPASNINIHTDCGCARCFPSHHEEIQTPTLLDILTFLHFMYGTGFHGEFQ